MCATTGAVLGGGVLSIPFAAAGAAFGSIAGTAYTYVTNKKSPEVLADILACEQLIELLTKTLRSIDKDLSTVNEVMSRVQIKLAHIQPSKK